MIKVVNCMKDSYDILIDRTTMWGNPFRIGRDGSRSDVIKAFELWLRRIDYRNFKQKELQLILDNINKLNHKTLGCWCKPKSCHGDIYADIIEERMSGIIKL